MKHYCPRECVWLVNELCTYNIHDGSLVKDGDRFLRPDCCKVSFREQEDFYKRDVLRHREKVQQNVDDIVRVLKVRGQSHDLSKMERLETLCYMEPVHMLNNTDIQFGTEEYAEQTSKMGEGLKHHIKVNDHHIEHHAEGLKGMSLCMLLEMLCDWKAAAERNGGVFDVERSINHVLKDREHGEIVAAILRNTVKELWGA